MSDAGDGLRRSQPPDPSGPIAWMVANRVAANTLAAVLLLGGLLMMGTLRQEVFPEFQPDVVSIEVPYPGASPEEVEQGVVLAIEEALRGIDAVETVTALAREDHAQVVAELFLRADRDRAFNDVQAAVGRITTFPEDAESPVVMLPSPRIEVVSLILHGDFHRRTLRELAEAARNELLRGGLVTHVEVTGIPPLEISIEVPHEKLREYQLTLAQVADAVAAASIDLPAGEVRAPRGEIAIRTTEERRSGQAIADVVLRASPDGTHLRLGDVAEVVDGFRETALQSFFNDQPAVRLRVFRVGEQQPLEISAAVRELAERWRAQMPDTVGVAIWNDYSVFYGDRVGMLVEKGLMGLALVLLVLGAFLHPRLAVWVSLGIAIAFLGGLLLMPPLGVTINMISLFAFILVLGIVVDDAIVVGEAVHANSRAGPGGGFAPADAAVAGAREVAVPVTFAVATTIVAFVPMLFVPGIAGDFFRNIPLIAIPILLISLLHGFFVLPAQLSASKGLRAEPERNRAFRWVVGRQAKLAHGLENFIERRYLPFARRIIALRYLTLAVALAVTVVLFGLVVGGRVEVRFMEDIEGEVVTASFVMPFGTPLEQSRPIARRLAAEAEQAVAAVGGSAEHVLGVYVQTGALDPEGLGDLQDGLVLRQQGGHVGAASLLLVQADQRPFSSRQLTEQWRQAAHWPAGAERLRFEYRIGPAAGARVEFRLLHQDWAQLERAAEVLAERMRGVPGTRDIDSGRLRGKEQVNLTLKPEARALGLRERDLAQQTRAAFFGVEAVRQQRERDEVRVYARLPEAERRMEYSLENLLIRTPDGGEIPLAQAAVLERDRSQTSLQRHGGRRAITVSADTDPRIAIPTDVARFMEAQLLPPLAAEFPGLEWQVAGQEEDMRDALGVLALGFALAALVMYALMAIVFRSYLQPLLIISAIPFGIAGAILGHVVMGFDLSMISMFGIVALAGVVVNDSLVLVYLINTLRRQGMERIEAVLAGLQRRFRPILLTSITAFLGLAPMIFETSVQARMLVPMAISLGFGVLFVTPIALIVLPAMLLIMDDVTDAVQRAGAKLRAGA